MKSIFTLSWLKAAGIRAAKTFAQNTVALITTNTALTSVIEVDWTYVLGASCLASLTSMLASLAGLPEVSGESTSYFKASFIRALKTFSESAAGILGMSATIAQVDWKLALTTAALAAILSIFTSIAGLPEVDNK